jgi:hypothetical protein
MIAYFSKKRSRLRYSWLKPFMSRIPNVRRINYLRGMISVFLHFCATHPFLLMVILVTLMLVIFYKTNKNDRTIYWSNLAWLLPVFGIVNFIWGDEWNPLTSTNTAKKAKASSYASSKQIPGSTKYGSSNTFA